MFQQTVSVLQNFTPIPPRAIGVPQIHESILRGLTGGRFSIFSDFAQINALTFRGAIHGGINRLEY